MYIISKISSDRLEHGECKIGYTLTHPEGKNESRS